MSITADPSQICRGPVTRVAYIIKVWNDGNVNLSAVTIGHDIPGDFTTQFLVANGGSDLLTTDQHVGNAVMFTVFQDISGATTNQASAEGFYPDSGTLVEDTAEVTVTDVVCEISGYKFQDLLGDGSSLSPLSGWIINLYNADESRLLDTRTTQADGSYSFLSTDTTYALGEGDYVVREVIQPNWQQTYPGVGSDFAFNVTLDALTAPVASQQDFHNSIVYNRGRMTGGGSIFDLGFRNDIEGIRGGRGSGGRITHGFQLRYDLSVPSRLQINWDRGNSFHLTELTIAECGYNEEGYPEYHGVGVGRCNGVDGFEVDFTFSDHGPGYQDLAGIIVQCGEWTSAIVGDSFEVTTESGEVWIESDHRAHNNLHLGNHQAHDWDTVGRTGAGDTTSVDGITVTFQYEETNGVTPTDPFCTPLVRRTDKPGNNDFVYELGETWVYTCSTTVLTNRVSQYATAGGNHSADGGARWASAASSVRRTVATDHSAGTVSFTFSMSNLSQNNLSSPSPSDTQCDPLLRMEDDPGNNDNVFEPDETWVYTCSNPRPRRSTRAAPALWRATANPAQRAAPALWRAPDNPAQRAAPAQGRAPASPAQHPATASPAQRAAQGPATASRAQRAAQGPARPVRLNGQLRYRLRPIRLNGQLRYRLRPIRLNGQLRYRLRPVGLNGQLRDRLQRQLPAGHRGTGQPKLLVGPVPGGNGGRCQWFPGGAGDGRGAARVHRLDLGT